MTEQGSAETIIKKINEFIATTPLNDMPGIEKMKMFDQPVVKFAHSSDPLFTELKTIIADTHMTPGEVLAQAYQKKPEDMPERLSVISWVLPITEKTRKSNRKESKGPSRLWSHTRWFGEMVNDGVRELVVGLLMDEGCMAVAPATAPYLKLSANEKGPYSNWSERHVAFVAGQGAFGLSDGLITEKGIAHRCGSVVTDMVLPVSPRVADGPYANCLYYFRGSCGKCIKRCPAGAITKEGHDKVKCGKYLNQLGYSPAAFADGGYDLETSVAGCGLCQTDVPCEDHVPKRIQRSREKAAGK